MAFDQKAYQREYRKVYRAANAEALRGHGRRRHLRAKLGAFNALGGPVCRDCGEDELEFLTLGHLNGGGARDRSEKDRKQIYLEIANGLRPLSDYVVQCRNCNSGSNSESCHARPPTSSHSFSGDPCRKCGSPKLIRSSSHPKYGTRKRTECRHCQRAETQSVRTESLSLFGGRCACCRVYRPEFLTFDHVHNDGSALRKSDHCGTLYFYRRLLSGKLNSRLYQVLCWNCNYSKHIGNGACIHIRKAV